MKKEQLKQLIKPLVKECITEILLEEGLLANVVSEVATGLRGTIITEQAPAPPPTSDPNFTQKTSESRAQISAYRRNLMESLGEEAYNGVNLFEGTDPLQHSEPVAGHADLGSPRDAGVDISGLTGKSAAIWNALK